MHKIRVCSLGFRLSVDGGLQLLAHRQRPDLVDREDGAQVGRRGGFRRLLALEVGLQLLPAVQMESPCRCPVPGVQPAAPRPPPETVEGIARVPGAGRPQHNDRQGVFGAGCWVGGCGCLAGLCSPGAWSRRPPGSSGSPVGAGLSALGSSGHFPTRSRRWCLGHVRVAGALRVPAPHAREVTPPIAGRPAFPLRQAFVRWDAESLGSCWRGSPSRPPVLGAGWGSSTAL